MSDFAPVPLITGQLRSIKTDLGRAISLLEQTKPDLATAHELIEHMPYDLALTCLALESTLE